MNAKFFVVFIFILTGFATAFDKPSVEDVEKNELKAVAEYNDFRVNNNLPIIEYDDELTRLAKEEAESLAQIGKLQFSKLNLDSNYVGFIYKITGLIGSNDNYSKIFFKKDLFL